MSLWDTKISRDPTMQGHTLPQPIIDLANQCKTFKSKKLDNYDPKNKDSDPILIEAPASKPDQIPMFAVVQVNGINAYYKIDDDISLMIFTEPNFPVTLSCEAYSCSFDPNPSTPSGSTAKLFYIALILVIIYFICCCCCFFLLLR